MKVVETVFVLFAIWFAQAHAIRVTSRELGLVHFDLYGHLPAYSSVDGYQRDKNDSVVFSTFLKGHVHQGTAYVRGIAYIYSLEEDILNAGLAQFSLHPSAIGWSPDLILHDVHANMVHKFALEDTWKHVEAARHTRHSRKLIPFAFDVSFELHSLSAIFDFHVASWDKHWLLTQQELFPAITVPFPNRPLNVVLPPAFGQAERPMIEIIALNVLHHIKLGLGVVIYADKDKILNIAAHPCLAPLVDGSQVTLVTWTETSQSTQHPRAFKSMVWGHAILAGRLSPSKLVIIDVDEFVLFSHASAQDFLNECVGNASQAVLPRFDTVCKSCKDIASDAVAFGWTNSAAVPDSESSCTTSPLQQYGPVAFSHDKWTGKTIVDAELVNGFAVHGGHTLRGDIVQVPRTCGSVLHLVNFWKHRRSYKDSFSIHPLWHEVMD